MESTCVKTGLDRLEAGDGPRLSGRKVSLLCHPASISANFRSARQIVEGRGAILRSLLGPEHGLDATAQDMIFVDSDAAANAGPPVHSLYGPTEASLWPEPSYFADAELVLIDLQDIGARYYTYVWTAVMTAEVALMEGLEVWVLDRPNPLGGDESTVEGGKIEPAYESFVGFHDISVRHSMTIGELVRLTLSERGRVDLSRYHVLQCGGWSRRMLFSETGLPWVLPSPNMPTLETALVYPGQCLWEGTLCSEGRGTTRPFELFGAPWIDAEAWREALDPQDFPGLRLRPVAFEPTFQKHARRRCAGLQLHVVDAKGVRSLRSSWALLRSAFQQSHSKGTVLSRGALPPCGEEGARDSTKGFRWRSDPYEYVADRPAIDLLAGGPWLRDAIESGVTVDEMERSQAEARRAFLKRRAKFLLYPA